MNKKASSPVNHNNQLKGEAHRNTKRQKNLVGGLKNEDENEKLADRIVVNVKMVHDGAWTPACAGL